MSARQKLWHTASVLSFALAIAVVDVSSSPLSSADAMVMLGGRGAAARIFPSGLRLKGGGANEHVEDSLGAADPGAEGPPTATKSRAKSLRKAAEKDAKKRPDPEGIKALEEGGGPPPSPAPPLPAPCVRMSSLLKMLQSSRLDFLFGIHSRVILPVLSTGHPPHRQAI